MDRNQEKKLEQISPFELKNQLIDMAKADARKSMSTFLNAGRGNPNWIATAPRDAFFLLGQWAMEECRRIDYNTVGVAATPASKDASRRLLAFLSDNSGKPGADLLSGTFNYLTSTRPIDPDTLAFEWAEAIIGDQYPTPDRILTFVESLVRDYLAVAMGAIPAEKAAKAADDYDLFATEGGTAAMCYCFDSLQANYLVNRGDTIALMTPIFTPYLEIPELERFSFNVVKVSANKVDHDGYHTWRYPDEELDKLRDPNVKLVCLVNPGNPPSYALSQHTVETLVDIVKNSNPNLMIITDDVYGTFVKGFRSLMYELPQNTLCVYSFSKYFGCTGWRLSTIALARDNVYDRLIAALSADKQALLERRYSSINPDTRSMRFIDRMVADSRMVALNHTAGLSTPQQMQMALMAAQILLDHNQSYCDYMIREITTRLEMLWSTTGFTLLPDPRRAGYYSEIDIMVWAKKFYGDDFASWLSANYEPVDFVIRLAQEDAIVLLNGDGFAGPEWSVRVSLANLDERSYLTIGAAIRKVLDSYHQAYASRD